MKKATCIVSLLMALALVLTGMGPVLADQAQPPVVVEPRAAPVDFAIETAPAFGVVAPGTYLQIRVGVAILEGITPPANVTLAYHLPPALAVLDRAVFFTTTSCPDGPAAFPSTIEPGTHVTVYLHVACWVDPGNHTISFTGTGLDAAGAELVPPVVRYDPFLLSIEDVPAPPMDFAMTVDPVVFILEQGDLATPFTINVTHLACRPDTVVLTVAVLEPTSGVTISLNVTSGTPMPGVPFLVTGNITVAPYADVVPSPRFNVAYPHTIVITGTSYADVEVVDLTLSVVPPPHDIPLEKGWNLISLPVMPLISTCIEHVLADYDPAVLSQGIRPRVGHPDYDPTPRIIRVWRHVADGIAPHFGAWELRCFVSAPPILEFAEMKEGYGYWIKMDAAAILTVRGSVMPPAPHTPPFHQLHVGWNLIGVRFVDDVTVAEYLGPVIIEYVGAMWYFDAVAGRFMSLDPVSLLRLGHGFWIYIHAHVHPLRIATAPFDFE